MWVYNQIERWNFGMTILTITFYFWVTMILVWSFHSRLGVINLYEGTCRHTLSGFAPPQPDFFSYGWVGNQTSF